MNFDDLQKKYCSFEGRLNRWATFVRYFQIVVAGWVVAFICYYLLDSDGQGVVSSIGTGISSAWGLVASICSISIIARRLHDLNHSGWWQLFGVVPMIFLFISLVFVGVGVGTSQGASQTGLLFAGLGVIAFGIAALLSLAFHIYVLFFKGTVGENDYGPDPLQASSPQTSKIPTEDTYAESNDFKEDSDVDGERKE